FQLEVQANGDGTARILKTRVNWSIGGLSLVINDDRGDQEFLRKVQGKNEFVPITITFASQNTYQGRGQVVDELSFSSESSTADVTLTGEGELTKQ
ncbi:MAG TPA: hypothetical protein VFQ61_06265, partial [Polyangiaceae bacterium]|nr:hypothetical protein [Polyangiaceae bacterium]